MASRLLKKWQSKFNEAMGQWTQLLNQLQNGVIEQITSIIGQVDNYWTGEDANQFKDELTRKILPSLEALKSTSTKTQQGMQQASDKIDATDAQARQRIADLHNTFRRVF